MKNQITESTFAKAKEEMEKLLFPVEFGEVFVINNTGKTIPAPHFKGVLAFKQADHPEIMSVVTDNYDLISNKKAIETGKKIFSQLFEGVNAEDILPYKVIYPKTLSYCHIQLVDKNVNFEVWEQETWMPFIQLTNSYNRTFALTYELGFVRELCNNGVIFRKKTVELKSVHNRGAELEWKLNIGLPELKKLQTEFIAYMKNLKRFYFAPRYILPLVCKVLGFDFHLDNGQGSLSSNNTKELGQFEELKGVVESVSGKYFNEIGHNAYAAFNVITHIISNEHHKISKFKNFSLHSTSYYYKPTEWIHDFIEKIDKPEFDIEKYLKDYLKYAS